MIIGPGITLEPGVNILKSGVAGATRQVSAPSTNPYVTWTSTGITTASTPSLWGTGSGNFTTATRITNTAGTFMDVGSGDFTIEFWMYVPSATSSTTSVEFLQSETSGGLGLRFGPNYNGGSYNWISIYARNQADLDKAAITWPRDQWNFVVVQRSGANINFWVNGYLLTRQNGPSGTAAGRTFVNTGGGTNTVGQSGAGGNPAGCYFNDLCISKSYARYPANSPTIAIPNQTFSVDVNTSLLMHFTGANGGTVFQNAYY